jgi:hypothetical protein
MRAIRSGGGQLAHAVKQQGEVTWDLSSLSGKAELPNRTMYISL